MSPRGRKKSTKPIVSGPPEPKAAPPPEEPKTVAVLVPKQDVNPLDPGQKYFEAPDGTILIGSATDGRMWYQKQGIWIKPRR